MISKELLSEVLGDNFIRLTEDTHDESYIWYEAYVNMRGNKNKKELPINIHELAHKCKLKMFDLGYAIKINILGVEDWNIEIENCHTGKICFNEDFYHNTEPEAIFKACELLLKENR